MQGTEQVTRLRPTSTGVDRYNAPVVFWSSSVLADLALFDPGGSMEPREVGRDRVVTTPKLYFYGCWPDIAAGDRVQVRGVTFTVEGRPADYRGQFGFGGLVVELQEVAG